MIISMPERIMEAYEKEAWPQSSMGIDLKSIYCYLYTFIVSKEKYLHHHVHS